MLETRERHCLVGVGLEACRTWSENVKPVLLPKEKITSRTRGGDIHMKGRLVFTVAKHYRSSPKVDFLR